MAPKPPTMWCVLSPKGKLLINTLSQTKGEAFFLLFGEMSTLFQTKHWKNLKSSKEAYKRMKYRVCRVHIVPIEK